MVRLDVAKSPSYGSPCVCFEPILPAEERETMPSYVATRRSSRLCAGIVFGAVLAALVAGCRTTPALSQASFEARVQAVTILGAVAQERLDALVARLGAPGATVGFAWTDGRSGAIASGLSSKTTGTAMQPSDRMLAGSIGKTYVAAVMLQLVEEGRVDLDQRVSHWLGGVAWFPRVPNAGTMTLRQLMNHTSGIPEHVHLPEMMAALRAEPEKVWRPEELVAFVLDHDQLFPAGEGWSYADMNYILVGMIIERVTGRTFYDELADRILKPLELADTIPSDRIELPGLVSGYTSKQSPFPVPEEVCTGGRFAFNPQMEWTGGGLMTSAQDLARWGALLYGGDVVTEATKAEMYQGVVAPRLGPGHEYGLGVIMRDSALGPAYGHSGWFPGYISMMAYYPDRGLALAVQFNTDVGVPSPALGAFLDELAGAAQRPPG